MRLLPLPRRVGGRADFVLCQGRRYSELLSRRMVRRLVIRGGVLIRARLPDYFEIDYDPSRGSYLHQANPEALEGLQEVAKDLGVQPWDRTLGGRFPEGQGEMDSYCSHCLQEECACQQCIAVRRKSSLGNFVMDLPGLDEGESLECPRCGQAVSLAFTREVTAARPSYGVAIASAVTARTAPYDTVSNGELGRVLTRYACWLACWMGPPLQLRLHEQDERCSLAGHRKVANGIYHGDRKIATRDSSRKSSDDALGLGRKNSFDFWPDGLPDRLPLPRSMPEEGFHVTSWFSAAAPSAWVLLGAVIGACALQAYRSGWPR